jgi:hypothetical protein
MKTTKGIVINTLGEIDGGVSVRADWWEGGLPQKISGRDYKANPEMLATLVNNMFKVKNLLDNRWEENQ